jgi:predicted HD phosphohydrolase
MDDRHTADAAPPVAFRQMKDGTAQEYLMLREREAVFIARTGERLLAELRRQHDDTLEGYRITRLEHALQCATRARRDGASDEWIVAALFHDIADGIAPENHDRAAAEILRPYVGEPVYWVVRHHGLFQMYYYGHHYGWNRDAREAYRDHPHFQLCVDFCEKWDQASFDETYPSDDLASFIPVVARVFPTTPP